jgi:uncharacterized protein (DUF58 family)
LTGKNGPSYIILLEFLILRGTYIRNNPQSFSSQAAGYLLRKPGLISLGAILVFAAWSNQTPIVTLMGLFLSAALVAKAWSRLCLMGVTCRRFLSETRVFPGEKVKLTLHLVNRKPLPLPWVRVDEQIPSSLGPEFHSQPHSTPESTLVRRSAALLWYTSVRWSYTLECNKRGYYPFGSVEVTSGDIFGLYSRSLQLSTSDHIIVYPVIFPEINVPIPSVYPMGNAKMERRIIQDPTRAIGVRDYRLGDSMRHIHWKASARAQGLKVKVFEATTTFKMALFLSVDSFYQEGSFKEEDFELGISAAASIAYHVVDHGGPAGLFVNTRLADSGQAVSIFPSGNRGYLADILEALAKTTASWNESFTLFLDRERRSLQAGTTLVLVFCRPPQNLPYLLTSLRESGYKLFVLFVGHQDEFPIMAGVPWLNVRSPADLARN